MQSQPSKNLTCYTQLKPKMCASEVARHFDPGLKGTTWSRFNRLARMPKWKIWWCQLLSGSSYSTYSYHFIHELFLTLLRLFKTNCNLRRRIMLWCYAKDKIDVGSINTSVNYSRNLSWCHGTLRNSHWVWTPTCSAHQTSLIYLFYFQDSSLKYVTHTHYTSE